MKFFFCSWRSNCIIIIKCPSEYMAYLLVDLFNWSGFFLSYFTLNQLVLREIVVYCKQIKNKYRLIILIQSKPLEYVWFYIDAIKFSLFLFGLTPWYQFMELKKKHTISLIIVCVTYTRYWTYANLKGFANRKHYLKRTID